MFLNFLEEQVEAANSNRLEFTELISHPCLKKGSNLKIGTKVKNMNDEKSINRIIEKLFKKDLIKKKEEKDQMSLLVKTMAEFYQKEKELFEKALREIMENKEILVFSITDMLRGKCLFESVDEINECVSELKE